MGIPLEMRDAWINKRKSLLIPSPSEEEKIAAARLCTHEGVRAGTKAAVIACVITAVPTLLSVRMIPWAKHNLNYTAQALIISAASLEQNQPFMKSLRTMTLILGFRSSFPALAEDGGIRKPDTAKFLAARNLLSGNRSLIPSFSSEDPIALK
ncbi:hypothetical protein NE237_025578 [Protea cynaroides]|uniref:Uncharacterized protein n=1 Tax=Protea cynaroides TaxID=273540 RepID=A0A9Q0H6I2_9MAGN|nr:hypothetical protein NE237_025578 [Protea cynaroides]